MSTRQYFYFGEHQILVYENVSGHPPADPINPSVVQHDQAIRFQ